MAVLGPGLGRQQVVVFTQPVYMAPLRQPRGVQRQTADVEQTGFTQRVSGLEVDLGDPDGEVAGVRVFELRAHCGGQVGLAVVVEEEVRIEAPSSVYVCERCISAAGVSCDLLVDIYRITPRVLVPDIFRRDVHAPWGFRRVLPPSQYSHPLEDQTDRRLTSGGLMMSNQVVIM